MVTGADILAANEYFLENKVHVRKMKSADDVQITGDKRSYSVQVDK